MTPKVLITMILGLAIFIAINAGTAYWLQGSLYVFRSMGVYQHWAIILMLLPILSGIMLHVAQVPFRKHLIPIGAIIAAFILFPAYRDKFWAEPPQLYIGFIYAAIVAGMALIPNQRPLQQARDMWSILLERIEMLLNKNKKPKRRVKKAPPPKPKVVKTKAKKPVHEKNAALRFFESPQYNNALDTFKHLITLASIILSAYSIIALGKGD